LAFKSAVKSVGVRSGYSVQVAPLSDLLHVVLHFVIRAMSAPVVTEVGSDPKSPLQSPGAASRSNTAAQAQHYRKLVGSLRSLCPALLAILADGPNELEAADSITMRGVTGDIAVASLLLETASRCLGILFDLFPDSVSETILSAPAVRGAKASREIFSEVLCTQRMDLRLRIRMLKILAGVVNMAPTLGSTQRVRDMINSFPLHDALLACARTRSAGGEGNKDDGDQGLFAKLASKILSSLT